MVSLVGGFPTCISFGEQTQKRVGWRAPAKIGHGLRVLFYGLMVGLRFFWWGGHQGSGWSQFYFRLSFQRLSLVYPYVSVSVK